jgi:hypothetical protein
VSTDEVAAAEINIENTSPTLIIARRITVLRSMEKAFLIIAFLIRK